jgi:peptidoglycan-N-acetylglucosamine deacetylase
MPPLLPVLAFFVASGSVAHAPRRVAFTFDDGPSFRTTPALLTLLDRWGVRATFFVNGHRFAGGSDVARMNREVLLMEHERGHVVGNHTYDHQHLRGLPPARQLDEIVRNENAIFDVIGERPTLFRPPYGREAAVTWRIVHERGYRVVLWDVTPLDFNLRTPARLRDRVMAQLREKGGGIVLLHDTYTWTVQAFELIMEAIKNETCRQLAAGEVPYQVVSLQEMLDPRADPLGRERWLSGLGPSCPPSN